MRMMGFVLAGVSALALMGAAGAAEVATTGLTCGTPIAVDATEDSLKKQFGAENVVYEDLGGPEGMELLGTRLFKKDPTKTLEIIWRDEKARAGVASITVEQQFGDDGEKTAPSEWVSAEGIKVGMSIADVEKINGKPFKISGFGWDYGGNVIDWNGGKLEKAAAKDCQITMTFGDTAENTPETVLGEGDHMSNDKDVLAAKPVIGRYEINSVPPT